MTLSKFQNSRRLRDDDSRVSLFDFNYYNRSVSMTLLVMLLLIHLESSTAWLSRQPKPTASISLIRSNESFQGFNQQRQHYHSFGVIWKRTTVLLQSDKFKRDLDDRSNQRAQGKGAGEMAAGAILGGLIMGPFGALFGAQMGANFGAKNAIERARKEEMERLGVSQDMLDAAQECGLALQQSMEGLDATRASLETQQSLARRLDRDVTELYDKAKTAMTSGNEDEARNLLLKRTEIQNKLKNVLLQCAEEKRRFETMQENVRVIEARALEVDALLQRTVGAKARQNSFDDFSLSSEDPLLQKFRDMGID